MRKGTKAKSLPVAVEEGPPRTHRTGPVKEKQQISVRLDGGLMKRVQEQMKEGNMRITDLIERGLNLALGEAEVLPGWTERMRFVLANVTRDQERLIRGLAIAMVEHEVVDRSEIDERVFDLVQYFLMTRNRLDHAGRALELYSRYGKSAEEISKLG